LFLKIGAYVPTIVGVESDFDALLNEITSTKGPKVLYVMNNVGDKRSCLEEARARDFNIDENYKRFPRSKALVFNES
jgi:hypothetical protein